MFFDNPASQTLKDIVHTTTIETTDTLLILLLFLTLNVRTLTLHNDPSKFSPDGEAAALHDYCRMYSHIDILVLTETKLPRSGERDLPNFTMYHSGGATRKYGVAILINKKVHHKIHYMETTSDRLLLIHGTFNGAVITIIATYGPATTQCAATNKIRRTEFFELLHDTIHGLLPERRETLVILGDLNARVGRAHKDDPDNLYYPHLSPGIASTDRNESGTKLLRICCDENLAIANSHSPCGGTWYNPSNKGVYSQTIDHILLNQRLLPSVLSCGVDETYNLQDITDHRPLVMSLQLAVKCNQKGQRTKRKRETDKPSPDPKPDYAPRRTD